MKRIIILLMVMSIVALMVVACGGGGGGGGNIGSKNVLKAIALFTNDSYVDYSLGDDAAEASNLEEALRDMGHTVTPFTGTTSADFSDALSGIEVLVIPEMENGGLNGAIDAAVRDEIAGFVNSGGILVVFNEYYDGVEANRTNDLLNATFGYSIVATKDLFYTLAYNASGAAGTPFEDAVPATTAANNGTYPWDPTSLPAEAKVIYADTNDNAGLVYIPQGGGHIALIGWDWYSGKPVGSQDEGWWGVLFRAVSLNADHIDACLLHSHYTTVSRLQNVQNLMATGQFNSIDLIDVRTTTPTLAQLNSYDSVLVSPLDDPFADSTALGNVVADYVDSGGGLVLGMYTFYITDFPDWSLMGRFATDDYYAMEPNAGQAISTDSLGTIFKTSHPTMSGVQTLDVDDSLDTTAINPGATLIAELAGNAPLVATREIGGVRRADLGFPPDYSFGYDADTDGALLIANAMTWAADLPEPAYGAAGSSMIMSIDNPLSSNCIVESDLPVTGMPGSISKVKVSVDITHNYTTDLDVYLESPAGTMVELFTDIGGAGDNFTNTMFDDSAGDAIDSHDDSTYAPFTGTYMPEGLLADLQGEDGNGTWTLHITDDACFLDGGTLNSWTLMVR